MLFRLVLAELRHRPGRALFLLAGYSLGVAVMVVLLAVGEAMLTQARDRALVGGGDVVLVPAGISPELLRSGGATSLYLSIDHARFIQREVLESPRAEEEHGVRAASPVLAGKLVELSHGGRSVQAVATGEIPSRARAAGAAPRLLAGTWRDSPADSTWVNPSPDELYREIDHFHRPSGAAARDSTWAEWHYFNVMLSPERWIYLTLAVGGRIGVPGKWGGHVLLTVREPDGVHRAVTRDVPGAVVRFDTAGPDLTLGERALVRQEGGVYHVVAAVGSDSVDLEITPAPRRYFPPAELGGEGLVSGYVAPALYAEATGTVCLRTGTGGTRCDRVRRARAYHDHNWGVWRGVSWEWGSASNERLSLLYGVVRGDSTDTRGLFAYLVDDRGVRAVLRPRELRVDEWQTTREGGRPVRVPRRMSFADAARGVSVEIDAQAVHVSDLHRPRRRYFVQMHGTAMVRERGRAPERLSGFFETYVE
ncbi:MAG TPA: hypothetical protein VFL93_14350 [Longimicrobiaceae bacterium]|nr:hypothetical protein [Longimicrobiaceae bacterium]